MKFLFGFLFFFASATMSLAQYQVTLTTGAIRNAETNDPVEVKLIGTDGIESSWYRCDRPNINDFEYGSSGTYRFSAPPMKLSKIKIRLNGKDGWQFARASVYITDTKQSYDTGTQNVFFDNGHEETFDLRKMKSARYQITLITGQDNDKSGTDDPILIKLIGADGNETDWFRCDKPNHNDFERGSEDTYYFSSTQLNLEKIQIRLVGKDGWRFIGASVLLAGENQMYSTGKQNVLFDNSLNKTFTLERTPLVVAQNASIDVVANFEFTGEAKKIYFEKNGAPLHYHSIAGYRWQHLQDMIRLPDADGKQFYMGTFSQNCTNTEGGLVFVAELVPGETNGKVIWWDELNNRHKAGGFNHPGNLRRLGNTVVIAGQNWAGGKVKDLKSLVSKIGQKVPKISDKMKLGNGGQYVLFYDVSNPSNPNYMGKLNSCWNGQEVLSAYKDIDALTLSKVGKYYYLWYNGRKNSGVKCRSKILSPQASWELIEEGKDQGCSPLLFKIDDVKYAGGARFDKENHSVIYNQLQFAPGQDVNALTENSEKVTRIDVKTSTFKSFSFRDGTTYTLNSLSNGKSSIVITDVESDSTINIAEIECND